MNTRAPLSVICMSLLGLVSTAQSFEWAHSITGGQFDQQTAWSTCIDSQGSVITIGSFLNSTDLDPGPGVFTVTSNGDADVFIQKVDAFGNFMWGAAFGGTSSDWARRVAVDSENNILLTGRTSGTVDLDPGPGTDFQTTPNTVFAVYVIKLDPQGQYLWGRIFGGLGNDAGYGVAIDSQDNIITVGSLGNGGDLDPGSGVFTAVGNGQSDIFVQKMDPDGNFMWGAAMGGTAHDIAYAVDVDSSDDILVTGEFRNIVDFDPGPGNVSRISAGAEDIFVLKLNSAGLLLWVQRFGGTGSERGRAIAVGPDGGPVFTGRITSSTDFDPGPDEFLLAGSFTEDAFLCKLSSSGGFAWAFMLKTFLNEGLGLATDAVGNIYSTGQYGTFSNNPLDLDPGPGENLIFNNGGGDVWLASYTTNGDLRWGFGIGSTQNDFPSGVAVGIGQRVVICGSFRQTIDMDPGPGAFLMTSGSGSNSGGFVAMYGDREPTGIHMRLYAFQEGPYQGGFWPMKDDLRAAGLVPLEEPYTAMGYTIDPVPPTNPLVLSWTLSSAVVDWVLVEIRDPLDPSVVLARRPGLLKVSGAVTGSDGVSATAFALPAGPYHVALRHRNHLGVMTAAPITLGSSPINIDMRSPSTPTFGTNARKDEGGSMLLWAGNTVDDGMLKYVGIDNDRDPILTRIGGTVPTATTTGYWSEDVNMDGAVKYVGANNDRDPILQNIGGVVPTATRTEQLP
jgi:hypothetical protein